MKANLNDYIKKSHINKVVKFNEELEAFRVETGEDAATLYEDAFTSFTLKDLRVEGGCLIFEYDGRVESWNMVREDEDTGEMYEDNGIDGIVEYIKFFKSCLRRAKRYWAMDADKLDKIQDGTIEDDWTPSED